MMRDLFHLLAKFECTMYKVLFGVLAYIFTVSNVVSQYSTGPLITDISANQTKVNQGPADFICTVANIAGYDVLWKRTNGSTVSEYELISTNTFVNISDDRFSAIFNASTLSFNLHVDDIRPNDEGTYICEIPINSTYSITRETLLELNVLPFFFGNSSSAEITVDVNSDVKIQCYAGGSPTPVVYIMRDNDAPLRNNRTFIRDNVLEIKNITKKEEGRYRCYANNTASAVPRFILVEVRAPPIIRSCMMTVDYYPQASVALECSIESHVTPEIVWLENDRQYGSSEKTPDFESMVTSNGRLFMASLKINSVPETEKTYYLIKTNNPLGENQAIVGQFSSFPSCPPTIKCPQPDCPMFNIFILIVIIASIFGVWYMFRRSGYHSITDLAQFMPLDEWRKKFQIDKECA